MPAAEFCIRVIRRLDDAEHAQQFLRGYGGIVEVTFNAPKNLGEIITAADILPVPMLGCGIRITMESTESAPEEKMELIRKRSFVSSRCQRKHIRAARCLQCS